MRVIPIGTAWSALLGVGVAMGAPLPAQEPPARLMEFLQQQIGLDQGQLAAMEKGEAVVKVFDSPNKRDVTLFGIIQIDIAREAYVARLQDFAHSLLSPTRVRVGIVHDPAIQEDVAAAVVSPQDVGDVQACKPGDCKIKMPATAGPTSLLSCQIVPPMATALGISSLGTICGSSAMRLGRSKARTQPVKNASTMTCQSATHFMMTNPVKSRKIIAEPSWASSMMRRRSARSAMAPPSRVRATVGIVNVRPVSPRNNGELVSSNTSQPCATASMFWARTEASWPNQYKRKLRCFNALIDWTTRWLPDDA